MTLYGPVDCASMIGANATKPAVSSTLSRRLMAVSLCVGESTLEMNLRRQLDPPRRLRRNRLTEERRGQRSDIADVVDVIQDVERRDGDRPGRLVVALLRRQPKLSCPLQID